VRARELSTERKRVASKRQTTMAKLNRERAVQEKRARKKEKKDARAAERAAAAADGPPPAPSDD
jgi:hypothetical protein